MILSKAKLGPVKKPEVKVIDEESYLATHGASRQDIGEAALHKNKGRHSDKTWQKIIAAQSEKDHKLLMKRSLGEGTVFNEMIDLSGYSNGLYTLVIRNALGEVASKEVVKK